MTWMPSEGHENLTWNVSNGLILVLTQHLIGGTEKIHEKSKIGTTSPQKKDPW
jgi:hypothetical protein